MKKFISLFITISLVGLSATGQAENLLQVYQKAKESNPDLRKSLAERIKHLKKLMNLVVLPQFPNEMQQSESLVIHR